MNGSCENLNIKIGLLFSKLGIPPNLWTLLSLLPAFFGFAALYYDNLLAGLILFAASSAISAIDGAVARVTKSVSNLGAFLNGIIERYVEILFYLGLFAYLSGKPEYIIPSSLWMLLLVFGSIMPDFIKAYADHKKVITESEDQKRMDGVFGKNTRILMIYAGMLLGYFNHIWLVYMIAITTLLVNLASIQRIFYVISRQK